MLNICLKTVLSKGFATLSHSSKPYSTTCISSQPNFKSLASIESRRNWKANSQSKHWAVWHILHQLECVEDSMDPSKECCTDAMIIFWGLRSRHGISTEKKHTGISLLDNHCVQRHSSGHVYTERRQWNTRESFKKKKEEERNERKARLRAKNVLLYFGFPGVSHSADTGYGHAFLFAPYCIMLCQEMSQPAQDDPYGLSLVHSSPSHLPLFPSFCLELSSPTPTAWG